MSASNGTPLLESGLVDMVIAAVACVWCSGGNGGAGFGVGVVNLLEMIGGWVWCRRSCFYCQVGAGIASYAFTKRRAQV